MAMLETPSRIWRRIEAIEGQDMPSLPSLPAYDDSIAASSDSVDAESEPLDLIPTPIHSTPAPTSSHATSTVRRSSSSSTARFAQSIVSRSTKSALSTSRGMTTTHTAVESFDVSVIPSLPDMHDDDDGRYSEEMDIDEAESLPDDHLPQEEHEPDDASLTDALQSVSRCASPSPQDVSEGGPTPRKAYDYSISLRSETKPTAYDKFRNISYRKPVSRTRTPSLSRTTSSVSSTTNSTPHSTHSMPLPLSNPTSPFQNTPGRPEHRSVSGSHSGSVDDPTRDDIEEIVIDEGQGRSQGEVQEHDRPASQSERSDNDSRHDQFGPRIDGDRSPSTREPTFSSEEGPTSNGQAMLKHGMPTLMSTLSSAVTSPFTPTPAFAPRSRARFNVQAMSPFVTTTPQQAGRPVQDEDQVTPHTRRRSFLLSVINSTSRPRLKCPTPHPRRIDFNAQASPGDSLSTPRVNLQTAFAGATPRPRPRARLSHPLAQAHIPSSTDSGSESGVQEALPQWSTPINDDRASFISTASSHDLTTHQRANTSFDPVMGLGAQGHGVGRFNAGKLNTYLHSLNRRLQEENEALVERLLKLEEDKSTPSVERRLRFSGEASRRVSLPSGGLHDVEEDVSGEGWVEEKAELEKRMDEFEMEVQRCMAEKEEMESALENERSERARDKERWQARMVEVERGVEEIVKGLERKLREAEKRAQVVEKEKEDAARSFLRKLAEVEEGLSNAVERATRAEQALASGQELGTELREANERVGKVMGDLQNANVQIRELQDEVMRSDGRIDELEKELREEREFAERLEDELKTKLDELAAINQRAPALEDELKRIEGEARDAKRYTVELEEAARGAIERVEGLEDSLESANARIKKMAASEEQANERMERLEGDARRKAELARQMEEALDAAEKKMLADEEEIAILKSKIASLQREIERERERVDQSRERPDVAGPTEADMEALEDELDNANREVARLTTLLNQSPARKAMERARDTKIEMLEMEKEELTERVKALRLAMAETNTPGKIINSSGISPVQRHVLSIRTPKTPGGPLREMSWLNNTMADPTVAPLVAEISRLHRELDRANESIDDKLDKLEDAGLGVVGLTKKLDDARSRIVALEEETARQSRREIRRIRHLERVKCQKCHAKMDLRAINRAAEGDESSIELSHATSKPDLDTPPTPSPETLRENLRSVNTQLDSLRNQWDDEKRRLIGEKAALQDAANRLNAQVFSAKKEMKRVSEAEKDGERQRVGAMEELERARGVIAQLEADLKSERARLRGLTVEQNRVKRQKEDILSQLQRTELDMEDVRGQLQRFKQENHDLERELRANATADQKARLMEARVAENLETIEQLRQERSLLTSDHKGLQRRFTEISEQVNRLRDEYAANQASHDNHRYQLDLHLGEIDDLHRALSVQADQLQQAEAVQKRLTAEKNDVARTVATLEADLRRVRKKAEEFGRDLKLLRAEKERSEAKQKDELSKAEKARRESHAQIRLLNEQLESQRQRVKQAKEDLKNHVCAPDEHQQLAIKLQHNKECKGLIEQIRYLKAKFTREASLRWALGYQKQYLVVLLSRYEKSEKTIFAAIARIGFPTPPSTPPKRVRSLKSVAWSVLFTLRAKHASNIWREQCASKEAIAAALQEVRRRRAEHS